MDIHHNVVVPVAVARTTEAEMEMVTVASLRSMPAIITTHKPLVI